MMTSVKLVAASSLSLNFIAALSTHIYYLSSSSAPEKTQTSYISSSMAMLAEILLSLESIGPEKGLRDPSFSSYLSAAEESFVLSLAKQSFDDKTADGEIGVFGADKYFNESLDDEKTPEAGEKPVATVESKNQSSGLSVRSVSSWNSQSALLHRPDKSPCGAGAGKVRGRGYLGRFRCRCVCSDKSSVAVEEYESCGEILNQSAAKEQPLKKGFSPVAADIPCMIGQGPKRETYSISKDLPVKPRKSLEVFGWSPVSERRNKEVRLNWEEGFPRPAVPDGGCAESDSDASSDLFEIKDFASKGSPFFLTRQMSGSATPTAGYAPSEASIEWSVVTASAAEFPITSDYKELRSGRNTTNCKTGFTAPSDKPRRLSSSFLACNSQDSVKVVDHAQRPYEKISDTKLIKSQDLKPQTEPKLTAFDPGRNMRSLALSNSHHATNMLYLK